MSKNKEPIKVELSKSNSIDKNDYNEINGLGLSQLSTKDLSEKFKQVEIISYRKKHKQNNDEDKLIYELRQNKDEYTIESGHLFVGFLNINNGKKNYIIEIETGYEKNFFRRMLNVANNIYFDTSPGVSRDKKNSISDMQIILEYSFLTALKHAFVMGVPKSFQSKKQVGLNVKGKIDIKRYYKKDMFRGDRITYRKREHQDIQEIIDVLYKALSSISAEVKEKILPTYKNYENALKQSYSGKAVNRITISKALKNPMLNNSMYSKYKIALKWADIILNHKNLVSGDGKNSISGFLLDISELWEVYIYNLMKTKLDGYSINAQEDIKIYKNTFFSRTMEPDFVVEDDENNIYVLDTKFKKMGYNYYDVDREDIYQTHTYGFYYDSVEDKTLKLISLIYPSRKDPDDPNKLVDNLFGIEGKNGAKYAVSYLKEGKTYEELKENEEAFINRLKDLMV